MDAPEGTDAMNLPSSVQSSTYIYIYICLSCKNAVEKQINVIAVAAVFVSVYLACIHLNVLS